MMGNKFLNMPVLAALVSLTTIHVHAADLSLPTAPLFVAEQNNTHANIGQDRIYDASMSRLALTRSITKRIASSINRSAGTCSRGMIAIRMHQSEA